MAKLKPQTTELEQRVNDSGLIKPGAHPEYDKGPQISNPFAGIASAVARGINNLTGNRRSPSTVRDQGHAPAKPAPALTDAERERLSKKYLGG
jgi:hypothetical protein